MAASTVKKAIRSISRSWRIALGASRLAHRAWQTLQMRLAYLAYVVAAYNLCVQWHADVRLSLAT